MCSGWYRSKISNLLAGLPVPTNPHITTSTNASISLMWNYPPPPSEAVEMFMVIVEYSEL